MRITVDLNYEELRALKYLFEVGADLIKDHYEDEELVQAFDTLEEKLGRINPEDDFEYQEEESVYVLKLKTSYYAPGFDDNTTTKYYASKTYEALEKKVKSVKDCNDPYHDTYNWHDIYKVSLSELENEKYIELY